MELPRRSPRKAGNQQPVARRTRATAAAEAAAAELDTNNGLPAAKRRLTRLRKAAPGPDDGASPSVLADAALQDSQVTRASGGSPSGAGGSDGIGGVSSSSEDEGSDASGWAVHVPEAAGSSLVTLHMVHWGAGLGRLQLDMPPSATLRDVQKRMQGISIFGRKYKARRFDLRVLNTNTDEVEAAAASAGRKPQLQDFGTLLRPDGKQHISIEFMIRPRIATLVKLQGAANGVDLRPPALRQRWDGIAGTAAVQQQHAPQKHLTAQPVQQPSQQAAAPSPPAAGAAAAASQQPHSGAAATPAAPAAVPRGADTPPLPDAPSPPSLPQQMPRPVQCAAQEQQGRPGAAAGDSVTAESPPWRQKRPPPPPTPPAARTSAAQRQPQPQPRPAAARQPPAAAAGAAAQRRPAQRQWPGLPGQAAAADGDDVEWPDASAPGQQQRRGGTSGTTSSAVAQLQLIPASPPPQQPARRGGAAAGRPAQPQQQREPAAPQGEPAARNQAPANAQWHAPPQSQQRAGTAAPRTPAPQSTPQPQPQHANRVARLGRWSLIETRQLISGVTALGIGQWRTIQAEYNLSHRQNVHLKDRWRTVSTAVRAGRGTELGLDRDDVIRVVRALGEYQDAT